MSVDSSSVYLFTALSSNFALEIDVWKNHTYNDMFLFELKNALSSGFAGFSVCASIPADLPLMISSDKIVNQGDIPVWLIGQGLSCLARNCRDFPRLMVLQTESFCSTDDRNPFCGPPVPCTPLSTSTSICGFMCKCGPRMGSNSCPLRFTLAVRPAEEAMGADPLQICYFDIL